MNEDNEYCKPCSNYNTCFLVSCINHKPANPFSYDNPCPIRRVVYKCGIWNGALDYMTNFAKEQREKYNSIKNTKMEEYLKESLDNFNFTDYFNALCDSLEEHYRKEEIKMDYEKPNQKNGDAVMDTIGHVNSVLNDYTKGCSCNSSDKSRESNFKLDDLKFDDESLGYFKVLDHDAKVFVNQEHDICDEPLEDNNIVCNDSHTTEFESTADKPFTSNPCVSVLSKALVQLDKGEITLSEIANLAWILSDIFSDED